MAFNFGLLSDAALTGLSDAEKESLQKQATTQFLLGSLLSNDPSMGLKSALSVPDQYLSGQRAISEMKEKQRQRGEVGAFLEQYAPTPMQAGQRALAAGGRGPTVAAGQNQIDILNAPIDFNRALTDSLRLSGNPAQPQIRETLKSMQPTFVDGLRVDNQGRVIGSLPTQRDQIQTQYNSATGRFESMPVLGGMQAKIQSTPPEVSANTMLVPLQGGGFMQQAIPGGPEAISTIEGAKAVAQASGQVEQVIGADGRTYFVPRSSLLTQPPRTGGAGTTAPTGAPSGAVAKVSPAQATLDTAANERFKTFSNDSLSSANTASGRKIAAQQLYDLSTQINNNKLTGLQAGVYSYMNAIPGVGKLFEQDITDVTRMNQAIATAQLEKTAQQKGAASNLDAQVIARGYATLTDPASATRMLAAQEEALADKDIARNQFVENYTGDPAKISTAWNSSPDNKPIFEHPKFKQFLNEQVAANPTKPVLPAGFQLVQGKSGRYGIKKPDGSVMPVGQ